MICSEVEEAIPSLPSWIQMGLNSSNSIGRPQTELELATTIATFFESGMDLQQAMDKAKQGDLKCRASLPSVALYVQRFAGGPAFPLVHFLGKFGKLYGSSLLLGQDFFHHLANLDFKIPDQVFPFIRLAAWATMLTSPQKAMDGFAKMLSKADLERLKAPASIQQTKNAETMLADAWKTMENMLKLDQSQEPHLQRCYGRLAVRTMLFLCHKQKQSKEAKHWPDLNSILVAFTEEATGNTSSSTATSQSDLVVSNVLDAKPHTVALLQNPHMKLGAMHLVNI